MLPNFERIGEIDKDLCETLMKELLKPKYYQRAEYISSDEFDSENMAIAVLLAKEDYNSAYILVRWIGGFHRKVKIEICDWSDFISAHHKQKNFEALEPSPKHHQICLDLQELKSKLKSQPSKTSVHDFFSFKADLLEDISWMYPQAHQNPKRPYHYLLVGK